MLTEKDVPIREDHSLAPASPYAVARVAQEQLSQVYSRGYGLDIVCTRSFNHIGPGQSERFVVSSFVKQAVAVSRKQQKEIFVGRIDIVRDFIDVRDVIQAYAVILEKGKPGQVYNVCTGKGHSLQDVLEHICRRLDIPMAAKTKDAMLRPVENRMIVGENAQLRALGFQPQYDLSKSLDDMIAWWQNQISA